MPRLLRSVTPALLVAGLVFSFAGTASGAPLAATAAKSKTTTGTAELPYTLGIQGANGQSRVQVSIPQGGTATRLTGTLKAAYNLPGKVILTANGRKIAEVNAQTGGDVNSALKPVDLVDGVLPIVMSVKLESAKDCFADDNAVATLTSARVAFTIPAVAPTNIGAFPVSWPGFLHHCRACIPQQGRTASWPRCSLSSDPPLPLTNSHQIRRHECSGRW